MAATVLSGSVEYPVGFTVPVGDTVTFDPNVSTTVVCRGNVIVQGQLVMRPASASVVHALRFEGVDETKFVGGDVPAPVDTDVGLWVTGAGQLDLQGSPKVGWNRTGTDPSWATTDELVVAPQAAGDFTFRPFTKGGAVPSVAGPDGTVYPTEVANLSRNVRIEGTPEGRAHISIRSSVPQTVRHAAIRHMGPQQPNGDTYLYLGVERPVYAGVLGRYGLHFHHSAGSAGSLVEGVVVRNCGGRAFVPHDSHGVTFRDCVAYDVRDAGFWWDPGEPSNDIVWDRCAVLGVPINKGGNGYGIQGFLHGLGLRNRTVGCVAVACATRKVNAGGFMWPSSANQGGNVWTWENNIAHNCGDAGVGVWQNDSNAHVQLNAVAYRNGTGVSHGAYVNTHAYKGGAFFANGVDVVQHAVGRIVFTGATFGSLRIDAHALNSAEVTRYVDCRISGQIVVNEGAKVGVGVIRFESTSPATDLTLARFTRTSVKSDITVVNSDGATFKVA